MSQTSEPSVANQTAHTPGPWTAVDSAIEADDPERPAFTVVVAWLGGDVDESIVRANARLIAAAPELLAALIYLWDSCGDDYSDAGAAKMVRAAIDKATGR